MRDKLGQAISSWLESRVDAFGFAPVGRLEGAPEEHHPSRVCKDAATVVVYGKAVPRAVLTSPAYGLHLLHRSCHTVYPFLDEVGFELARLIEGKATGPRRCPPTRPWSSTA